jgi:predicted amidohydrolase YtcJ
LILIRAPRDHRLNKAIKMALDAFEYAAKTDGTQGRRHRVEHVEVPRLSDLLRFRRLGVMVSTQQLMARPDATELNNYAVLRGPERASHALAFKLFDDAGAVQASAAIGAGSIWIHLAIHVAVTRVTPEGTPKGG